MPSFTCHFRLPLSSQWPPFHFLIPWHLRSLLQRGGISRIHFFRIFVRWILVHVFWIPVFRIFSQWVNRRQRKWSTWWDWVRPSGNLHGEHPWARYVLHNCLFDHLVIPELPYELVPLSSRFLGEPGNGILAQGPGPSVVHSASNVDLVSRGSACPLPLHEMFTDGSTTSAQAPPGRREVCQGQVGTGYYRCSPCKGNHGKNYQFWLSFRPYSLQPPLLEWVRVTLAFTEHRCALVVDGSDVTQAARVLLPSSDCPSRPFRWALIFSPCTQFYKNSPLTFHLSDLRQPQHPELAMHPADICPVPATDQVGHGLLNALHWTLRPAAQCHSATGARRSGHSQWTGQYQSTLFPPNSLGWNSSSILLHT